MRMLFCLVSVIHELIFYLLLAEKKKEDLKKNLKLNLTFKLERCEMCDWYGKKKVQPEKCKRTYKEINEKEEKKVVGFKKET